MRPIDADRFEVFDFIDDGTKSFADGVQMVLEAIDNTPTLDTYGTWIPCEERLPEEIGRYLCTVGGTYRKSREMYYAPQAWPDKSDHATWRSIDGSYVFDWFVKAWQPLPEPYHSGEATEMVEYTCENCKHDRWHTKPICGKCIRQHDGKPSKWERRER